MQRFLVHPAASSGVFLPPMDGNAPANQLPHQVDPCQHDEDEDYEDEKEDEVDEDYQDSING